MSGCCGGADSTKVWLLPIKPLLGSNQYRLPGALLSKVEPRTFLFLFLSFAQTDTQSTAVLFNELNPGSLDRFLNLFRRTFPSTKFTFGGFEPGDRWF